MQHRVWIKYGNLPKDINFSLVRNSPELNDTDITAAVNTTFLQAFRSKGDNLSKIRYTVTQVNSLFSTVLS